MKHFQLCGSILLLVTFIGTLGCSDGDKGQPEIIDLCDGQREFLSIPDDADIIFSAGIYAQDLNAPTEIYAMDIDANKIYRISCSNFNAVIGDYAGPSASPDRTKIVTMRGDTDTNGDGKKNYLDKKGIWIVDIEQDTASKIAGYDNVNSPEWSVNNEIVFAASEGGKLNTNIYIMDTDGENVQNLTDTEDFLENDPGWSHDGKQIAYGMGEFITPEGVAEGTFVAAIVELWVMNSDGSDKTKVVSFDGDTNCPDYSDNFCLDMPADPAFLPDDTNIIFEKLLSTAENNGSGRWNVFSASLSGLDQSITNLTNDATAYQVIPHASEEGIIFHEIDVDKPFYGLVLIDLDGSNRTEILDNSKWEYYLGSASWLP